MNALQGYRTFLLSGIAIAVAVAGFVLNVAAGVGPIDAQASVPTILMALLMAALRVVTTTPPGKAAQTSPTLPEAESLMAQVEQLIATRDNATAVLTTLTNIAARTGSATVNIPSVWIIPPNQNPPTATLGAPVLSTPPPSTQPPAAAPTTADPP